MSQVIRRSTGKNLFKSMVFLVNFTSITTETKTVLYTEKNKSVERLLSITKVVKIALSTEVLLLTQKPRLILNHLN
jgi:hypothetical protein